MVCFNFPWALCPCFFMIIKKIGKIVQICSKNMKLLWCKYHDPEEGAIDLLNPGNFSNSYIFPDIF